MRHFQVFSGEYPSLKRYLNWKIQREMTIDVGVGSSWTNCGLFAYVTLKTLATQMIFGPRFHLDSSLMKRLTQIKEERAYARYQPISGDKKKQNWSS